MLNESTTHARGIIPTREVNLHAKDNDQDT